MVAISLFYVQGARTLLYNMQEATSIGGGDGEVATGHGEVESDA